MPTSALEEPRDLVQLVFGYCREQFGCSVQVFPQNGGLVFDDGE